MVLQSEDPSQDMSFFSSVLDDDDFFFYRKYLAFVLITVATLFGSSVNKLFLGSFAEH